MSAPPPPAPIRPAHVVPTVSPAAFVAERLRGVTPQVVDLRTPSEYAVDRLPGAVNLPIFDDEERAIIGTLYKRESPEQAFSVGREKVLARVDDLVLGIAELTGWELGAEDLQSRVRAMTEGGIGGLESALEAQKVPELRPESVVLHCWRGGLRSRSVVALLHELGVPGVVCLQRGYQGYRQRVIAELESFEAPPTFVLRGYTGTGKTLVLRAIERLRPGWTLDLEGCAGHRSSTLGMVGLEPTSQKRFESLIADHLRLGAAAKGGPLVLEGESRKVGDRVQPASVWGAMQTGTNVRLDAREERRIEVLCEDYLEQPGSVEELRGQLPFIERRLGPKAWAGRLVGLLDDGAFDELVALLLEHYYDPLYEHSEKGKQYGLTVQMEDPEETAAKIVAFIEEQMPRG